MHEESPTVQLELCAVPYLGFIRLMESAALLEIVVELRKERSGFCEFGACFRFTVEQMEQLAAQIVGAATARAQLDGVIQQGKGFTRLATLFEERGKAEVGGGERRIAGESVAVGGFGRGRVAEQCTDPPELVVGVGDLRFQVNLS